MKIGEIWRHKKDWHGYGFSNSSVEGKLGYVEIKQFNDDWVHYAWLYKLYMSNEKKWYHYDNLAAKTKGFMEDYEKVYDEDR